MQTFLPYPNFHKSLNCLDWRRLGKQRVEALQIYETLYGKRLPWHNLPLPLTFSRINHPAVRMWRNHLDALALYYNLAVTIWAGMGFVNKLQLIPLDKEPEMPPWLNGPIHATHRSNLLRKDYNFYRRYNWIEPNNLDYFWPE